MIHLGTEKIAELLLRNGSNVNANDQYRNTPLHWAAYSGMEHLNTESIEYISTLPIPLFLNQCNEIHLLIT